MAENQQRQSDLRPSCARLQCLRCRSEVTCQEEGAEQQEEGEAVRRRMRKALMLTGGEEEQDEEEETDRVDDSRGEQGGHNHLKTALNPAFVSWNFLIIPTFLSYQDQINIV